MTLTGAGTFLTDGGTLLTLGGTISGAGALTKDGTGHSCWQPTTPMLAARQSRRARSSSAMAATGGSITGNVANNGVLAFNRSDSLTFAGAISGSGALNQIGTGTTILTANSSYTGGTTISSGGRCSSAMAGRAVASPAMSSNNGALAFNRSDAVHLRRPGLGQRRAHADRLGHHHPDRQPTAIPARRT